VATQQRATVTKLNPQVDQDEAYENSVKPRTAKDVGRAKDVLRAAELSADRNRWFLICLGLIVVVLAMAFKLTQMSSDLASNYKVAWVKMDPSGTWNIDLSETQEKRTYLGATVESILSKWVRRRFSEQPETIRSDFGYVMEFLSPRLKADFTSETGFNAAQRAADIRSNRSHGSVIYEVGVIDHFDQDNNALFAGGIKSTVYRTNIYVQRKEFLPTGAERGAPDKKFITIEWRLMTDREINLITNKDGGIAWLRENPIGLEIVSYQENEDFSDNQ